MAYLPDLMPLLCIFHDQLVAVTYDNLQTISEHPHFPGAQREDLRGFE